ncbi:MAG: Fe2+-dependent dioxygenase [Hyphomonadaceae bacterium]
MSVVLQQVLAAEDLARVREGLAAAQWRSGKRTAGATARDIKDNLQADSSDARVQALETFVAEALRRHPLFEIAARPARLTRVMFSRYEPGMTYGAHTDDALMGGSDDRIRTDLAFTIFLEARDAYDGGALVVQSALGDQEIRLDAGDAIVYPAGSIHYVEPVTRGARLAAVGWIESFVADATQRETLFDLSIARARMAKASASRDDLLLLDKSISNLLRMWAR